MTKWMGLDFGSTRTKCCAPDPDRDGASLMYWHREDGEWGGAHDRRPLNLHDARKLAALLEDAGYTHVGLTGTGADVMAEALGETGVTPLLPEGDAFSREIALQVRGARLCAKEFGQELPEKFLLVGIGTGTSYTFVDGEAARAFPIGNPVGGGFIKAVCARERVSLAVAATLDGLVHADLLMKERYPKLADGPLGDFVLASMGNVSEHNSVHDIVRTAMKVVATSVARDYLLMTMMPDWKPEGPLVFVGTPTDKFSTLREWLTAYATAIGQQTVFVKGGDFAGARGACELARESAQGMPPT